jgi:hypothetical protein
MVGMAFAHDASATLARDVAHGVTLARSGPASYSSMHLLAHCEHGSTVHVDLKLISNMV